MNAVSAPRLEAKATAPSWPFYYGWVNLVMAAVAMTATFPGRTHGLSLINEGIKADLGIGDVIQGTFNFWSVVVGALFCWPVGRLVDRFGSRVVLTGVVAALGLVVVWMARVTGQVEFLLSLTLTRGLGQGALSLVSMALVGKWFHRRIGLAMGLFSVLLAFGFIAVTVGIGMAVPAVGWRVAWQGLGVALLFGVAPLSLLLVRSVPKGTSLADQREFFTPEEASVHTAVSATLKQALLSPAFWVLTLSASVFNLIFSGFVLFAQGILKEKGFDQGNYVTMMAMLTLCGIVFNLLGGWLSRSGSLGRLFAVGLVLLATGLAWFPFVVTIDGLICFGLLLGGSGGIITVVFFAMYNAFYGQRNLGQIQGVAQAMSVLASALGPLVVALSRERSDGFLYLMETTAAVSLVCALACWLVPTPALKAH